MDLGSEIKVRVGDDGLVFFKEPSIQESNSYNREKFPVARRGKMQNNTASAHVKYFDQWVIRIENISRGGVPLTLGNLDLFPARLKSDIMFKAFDNRDDVELAEADEKVEVAEDLAGNS